MKPDRFPWEEHAFYEPPPLRNSSRAPMTLRFFLSLCAVALSMGVLWAVSH